MLVSNIKFFIKKKNRTKCSNMKEKKNQYVLLFQLLHRRILGSILITITMELNHHSHVFNCHHYYRSYSLRSSVFFTVKILGHKYNMLGHKYNITCDSIII